MAIALALNPAWKTQASAPISFVSDAFSPAANSLIIIESHHDDTAASLTPVIADSVGLTWTAIGTAQRGGSGGFSMAWWAFTASAQTGMTVTVNWGTVATKAIKATTFTGTATVAAVISKAQNFSGTNNLTVNVANTNSGCLIRGTAIDWNALGLPVSTDDELAYHVASQISGLSVHKAATTSGTGISVPLNFDAFGAATAGWAYKVYEIVPDAGGGPSIVTLTPVTITRTAVPVTPVPLPVTVALTPVTVAVTPVVVAVTPLPGAVTLTPVVITRTVVPVTAVPLPVTVTLTPVVITPTVVPVVPVPLPVTVTLTPVTVAFTPVSLTPAGVGPSGTVILTPITITMAAVSVSPVPGPVTVGLTPVTLSLTPVAVEIGGTTPPPGSVTLVPVEIILQTVRVVPIGGTMPLNQHELPLAQALLACLETALMENPNPPGRICLRVGQEVRQDISIYEDECCEGLAYVKINQAYPSSDFPNPLEAATRCGIDSWAVDLEMGVFRCSPIGDEEHVATCTAWTATATQVAHDQAAMRQAIACFRGEMVPGDEVMVRPWLPLSTQGGCAGGTQVVTASFFESC